MTPMPQCFHLPHRAPCPLAVAGPSCSLAAPVMASKRSMVVRVLPVLDTRVDRDVGQAAMGGRSPRGTHQNITGTKLSGLLRPLVTLVVNTLRYRQSCNRVCRHGSRG